MKAVTNRQYGGPEVMKIEDMIQPQPKAGEVSVLVHCSTVTAGAVIARRGSHPDIKMFTLFIRLFFGLFKPRKIVSGYEFSGQVESLGEGVKSYQVGDRVFGTTTGLKQGSYAASICVPVIWKQGVMDKLPVSMSYQEGAALPIGAMTAYDLLGRTRITKGSEVMVYGGSGSVGTYMIQLAKERGAKVTAVCSQRNTELVKSLGADEVLDYKSKAYVSHKKTYDVIADAVGKMNKQDKRNFLRDRGEFVSISSPTKECMEGLRYMTQLVTKGRLQVVIDQVYGLQEIQKAHTYVETGRKKGNVIILVSDEKS